MQPNFFKIISNQDIETGSNQYSQIVGVNAIPVAVAVPVSARASIEVDVILEGNVTKPNATPISDAQNNVPDTHESNSTINHTVHLGHTTLPTHTQTLSDRCPTLSYRLSLMCDVSKSVFALLVLNEAQTVLGAAMLQHDIVSTAESSAIAVAFLCLTGLIASYLRDQLCPNVHADPIRSLREDGPISCTGIFCFAAYLTSSVVVNVIGQNILQLSIKSDDMTSATEMAKSTAAGASTIAALGLVVASVSHFCNRM